MAQNARPLMGCDQIGCLVRLQNVIHPGYGKPSEPVENLVSICY